MIGVSTRLPHISIISESVKAKEKRNMVTEVTNALSSSVLERQKEVNTYYYLLHDIYS